MARKPGTVRPPVPPFATAAVAALLAGGAAAAGAPDAPQPVPDALKPPAGQTAVLDVLAKGVQIYTCTRQEDGRYSWTFKAPEAGLFGSDGLQTGRHYRHAAGPAWELADGSTVIGILKAKAEAPGAGDIPWLLLEAKAHEGKGVLAGAASIQRLATKGGVAPATGCDAASAGKDVRVPYEARYRFYKAGT